jgi:hypothetical protein
MGVSVMGPGGGTNRNLAILPDRTPSQSEIFPHFSPVFSK